MPYLGCVKHCRLRCSLTLQIHLHLHLHVVCVLYSVHMYKFCLQFVVIQLPFTALQTDFANRDARAAFFTRTEGFDGPGPAAGVFPMQPMYNPMLDPHHRRAAMMMPRPGIPIMPISRGGFPPAGPPDLYYPYMDDAAMGYYGGRPAFGGLPVGPFRQFHHHPYDEAFEDYEEELRAFTRKRKRERELEKKSKRKCDDSSKSSDSESDSSGSKKKKAKDKGKKQSSGEKSKVKDEGSESEGEKEEQRLKATQKSRELREKRKSKKKTKSDGEASSEEDGEGTGKKGSEKKPSDSRGKEADLSQSMVAVEDGKKAERSERKKPSPSASSSPKEAMAEAEHEKTEAADKAVEAPCSMGNVEPLERSAVTPAAMAIRDCVADEANKKVESDLSSGEDFKDDLPGGVGAIKDDLPRGVGGAKGGEAKEQDKPPIAELLCIVPDTESHVPEEKQAKEDTIVKGSKAKNKTSSGDDSDAKTADTESKRVKQLPLRYQLNEEDEEKTQSRDHHRLSAPHPTSPPSGQRHKYRRSPSPPDHRWQRGARPYSPAGGHHRYRQYSRSPPGGGGGAALSPRRPQSPSFGSSPPPRPRSPAHRSREYGVRHRYDSPSRGKGTSSGHSPHRRRYSPSPSRAHSPGTRYHPRHRSRSPSLSKKSPVHPKEATPEVVMSSSPSAVRELKKQSRHIPGSRTPSPSRAKQHREEVVKEPPPPKRPLPEEGRPKSPVRTSPPPLPPSQKDDGRRASGSRVVVPLGATATSEMQHSPPLPPPLPQQPQQQQPQTLGKKPPLPAAKLATPTQPPPAATPIIPSTATTTTTAEMPHPPLPQPSTPQQQTDNLLSLLRRYPVMWQGHLALKNDAAAVQLHFLSGNVSLAKVSLPQMIDQRTPALRIVQRMRLEPSQLEGVERRIQVRWRMSLYGVKGVGGASLVEGMVGPSLVERCGLFTWEIMFGVERVGIAMLLLWSGVGVASLLQMKELFQYRMKGTIVCCWHYPVVGMLVMYATRHTS